MKQEQLQVRWVKWGFADRYPGGIVEVNRNLKKYPTMMKQIMKHESGHKEGKNTKSDFLLDMTIGGQVPLFDQVKFMLKHPTSITQILPIQYNKRWGLILDWNGIYWWIGIIAVTCALLWIF